MVPGGEATGAGGTEKRLFCDEDGELGANAGPSLPFVRETKKEREIQKESAQTGEIRSVCWFIIVLDLFFFF